MDLLVIKEGFPLLSFLIFLPLAGSLVLLFFNNEDFVRWWTLGITGITALWSIPLLTGFDGASTKYQFAEAYKWIPQFHINYIVGIDGISILLVLLTTLIMPFCVLASWKYIQKRVAPFMFCLLVMETSMIGVFVALDFILFYVFWEFMLIPMYLLIAIWGGPRKVYASIKFFLYTLAGSVLLLVAIIALYLKSGSFFIPEMMWQPYSQTFQVLVFLAFFLAFAIKVPMFPFHTWLPAAHVEAPTAGSVILASVLLKMGTYGLLRFCLPITPDATILLAQPIMWLSIAGILYGGFTALAQQDMKKLIAYSSVGHMGFVTLGIFLFNQRGVEGALFQMLNHGIITGGLFMMIGTVYERSHSRDIGKNLGLGKYMPAFMFFWGLYSLASFGFPGTNGFVGEALVFVGAFQASLPIGFLIVPGALLGAAYMFRVGLKLAWGEPSSAKTWSDLRTREWIYLLIPAVMVFYIGLAPGMFFRMIDPSIEKLLADYHSRKQVVQVQTEQPMQTAARELMNGIAEAKN